MTVSRPHVLILAGYLAACAFPATAAVETFVSGEVYADANGNAARDPGEPGIAGVKLSNGRDIVRTGADGRYSVPVRPGDTVFAIKPATHAFPSGDNGLPRFWSHYFPAGSPALEFGGVPVAAETRFDLGLLPATFPSDTSLEVLLFADPQTSTATDIDYYARDVIASVRDAGHATARLGLTLGDVVNDDLSLYPAINRATASLGVPWLHAPGNHDLDFDAPADDQSLLTFRRHFGPDTLAWEEPSASFVVLDDVVYRPGQSPGYVGGLREDQFAFLQAYLADVPRDRLLVVAAHIPFFDTDPSPGRETFRSADRERLFALLRDFPQVLLLTGHGHVQRQVMHDAASGWHGAAPLHEFNIGAACGAFWSGVKDAAGIPDATMADGTPNGYARLVVQPGGGHALSWHPARLGGDDPASTPTMFLHAPRVLRQGAYPAWGVYANVFMGREDSRVEYRVDDGAWEPMRRVERPDPRLLAENVRDDEAATLRGYDRSPEAVPSTHLWRGALPTDLAIGTHRVEVRFFDPARGEQRAATRYRLEAATP
ncbi:calcineurin phosphoesterase [Lysobacter arseniciresistens ZS79]|uniref:Calcineurin phosphoesterase n=1 Tax=Lysobacter arseniciresistens ZS79 TaxID=913325 RepID=A0A0A0F4V5_9GAMM|nr:calcineurin-like phosphoesterase family protein [Lysobacter arseniciresistens]KGM57849.1 calcineurin phosphoesterase [Lysobacter arseniciresistens ZS79]